MPKNCDKPVSSTHFAIQLHIAFAANTDESYTDVELPQKPLLFHVLISRPYDVCPRAAP